MNDSIAYKRRARGTFLGLAVALALTAPLAQAEQVNLLGLNLSGAGFAAQVLPGINGTNYIFPVEAYFQQWSARGVKLIRFPIVWERLQPTLGGALDPTYAALIDQTFAYAQKYQMRIILDLHNYMLYRGSLIGSSAVPYARYQEIMTRIAQRWSGQSALYAYDIMNEPHDAMAQWPVAAQYGINGVRAVDSVRPIMIEGNGWSEATRWPLWNDALLALKDPADNLIFQAHSYFDADAGGNYTSVDPGTLSSTYGVERVQPFVDWLKKNGKKGMIGEFGVPDNDARWLPIMDNMLAYLKQNCIPATYWAAGPGWGSYSLSVEPINGVDRPQWPTLKKYRDDSSCTAYGPQSSTASSSSSASSATASSSTSSSGSTTSTGSTSSSGNATSSSGTTASTGTTTSGGTTASSGVVTTAINDYTNDDWLHGFYRKAAGFSIPASAANVAAFTLGTKVTLGNGQTYPITYVQTVGSNLSVFVSAGVLDGNVVGYPKTLSAASSATTSTATTASSANTASTSSTSSTSSSTSASAAAASATTTGTTTGTTTSATGSSMALVGMNFSGAAFAPTVWPGVVNVNYVFPSEAHFQQWSAKGVKLIRFPIIWERLQTRFFGSLEPDYAKRVTLILDQAKKYGMKVILDLDNGGCYKGTVIGTSGVTNFNYWDVMYRIAYQWGGHAALYGYDIMGKPYGIDATWATTAQAGIDGVRTMDRVHPVIVEGNAWASAVNWPTVSNGLLGLKDSANNLIYAASVYLDQDGSGNYASLDMSAFDTQVGVKRVKPFIDWLKANGKRGMISEFGVPGDDARWLTAADNLLAYLQQNCMPVTYWAAGPGWGSTRVAVEPVNGVERPQWPTLKKYVQASNSCTAVGPSR